MMEIEVTVFRSAWETGFLACTNGGRLGNNPYELFTDAWSKWAAGWMAGNRFVAETREFFAGVEELV